ncbi:alternative ribosome rescue aminoacyl-tRNA hydrolase ArfB [Draconibacterium sp. IB214405]|uniref:alternative ribosome rescue aminoacyl-tRNA hydrolase ArfB n=1 Tax=Draconibacterium sp. IB214405 TaxID=3097352 RepID=UPI002A17B567|nr:alternative ribosome rescue aminoacyl-tRNA hydrolase ArfB [Draconibacterium sp. IB214405]MDX8339615.1 alternative ribosome rescue aminoacyl-tRNA hydrolase ArfB [Draconibacterium sp. IB214405]
MKLSDERKKQIESDFKFSATRSSGPGGQNVNKVNTQVELRFSLDDSTHFTEKQKEVLLLKLKNRINSENELVVVSSSERTQLKNKQKVVERFFDLVEKALTPQKRRIKTKPTAASRVKRLEAKKQQSEKKQQRKKGPEF